HAERIAAKAPVTCGVAMEVPLKARKLGVGGTDETMLTPGANRSTTSDTFAKLATTSDFVVALTVTALDMQPGKLVRIICESFPAAITVAVPAVLSASMALLNGAARALLSQLPETRNPESPRLRLIAAILRGANSLLLMRASRSFKEARMSESKATSALSEIRRENT